MRILMHAILAIALFATLAHGDSFSTDNAATTQTLTNKTLTSPAINGTVTTSGLTLPALTAGGDVSLTGGVLTAGTMTVGSSAVMRSTWHKFSWTNAMVVALGASATGDITVCTLPAKTLVKRAIVVVTGQGAGPATLTVAVGRVSAGFIDYVIASDAKAVANTVYSFSAAGTGLAAGSFDLPSYTGTTAVKAHFIATVATLDGTTGSTGIVYLETVTLP